MFVTTAGFLSVCRRIFAPPVPAAPSDEGWTDLKWSPSPSHSPSPEGGEEEEEDDNLILLLHPPIFSFSEKVVEATRRNARRMRRGGVVRQ
jgi:hypothetical protein